MSITGYPDLNRETVAAIFSDHAAAEHALNRLKKADIPELHAEVANAAANEKQGLFGRVKGLFSTSHTVDASDLRSLLVRWGVPAEDSEHFRDQIRAGRVLVIAHTPAGFAGNAAALLNHLGGELDTKARRSVHATTISGPRRVAERDIPRGKPSEPRRIREAESSLRRDIVQERIVESARPGHVSVERIRPEDMPTQPATGRVGSAPAAAASVPRGSRQPERRPGEEEHIQLFEETVRVETERAKHPEPKLTKKVVTESQRVDVPTRREVMIVERRKPNGEVEELRYPVWEEQFRVITEKVLQCDVVVRREVTTDTESIEVPVEREELVVEMEGEEIMSEAPSAQQQGNIRRAA